MRFRALKQFLIIQTAYTGDVVLATALAEDLHHMYPAASIDILLRKGNEGLLQNHPFLRRILVWNKKENKFRNLLRLLTDIRKTRYNGVFNAHRYASSGLITALSGASVRSGFSSNPLSVLFTHKAHHKIAASVHEIDRNRQLLKPFIQKPNSLPRLYPAKTDFAYMPLDKDYVTLSPASVWFTKQLPATQWNVLISALPAKVSVYLLGGAGDHSLCEQISAQHPHRDMHNMAGKLSFLQSAAIMQSASMNYSNDSAPLHMAGAVGARVTAFFCSTVPDFGFGPFGPDSRIAQIDFQLSCRPCGLHGRKACPEGHFKCALDIDVKPYAQWIR